LTSTFPIIALFCGRREEMYAWNEERERERERGLKIK
jgi:hypothetical protein